MAAPDELILRTGGADAPLDFVVPASAEMILHTVNADFVDNGASGDWLPAVVLLSQNGDVIARAVDQAVRVTAGSSAEVSFFPRVRRRATTSSIVLDYNLGEIGNAIGTGLADTQAATVSFQQITSGDGILVLATAPSLPSALATQGFSDDMQDSAGNSYDFLGAFNFQASPANVNEGQAGAFWFCQASRATMAVGVDSVTATWSAPVFDRVVEVWSVRHSGGALSPFILAQTADSDAAVFASNQVTLTAPNYTPFRDQGMEFALLIGAKVGGLGAFGNVIGWTGFFQAQFRIFVGSKQHYLHNPQTHGANAYLIAGAVPAPYEDDVGVLPGGVLVPSFNGVAQGYSAGANAWKGAVLMGLE